ncbi:18954_t:CDS:2, partial [Gigaspora rosea]
CKLLSAKFPNVTIYPHDLQNLIQKYKIANREKNDTSNLLRHLLNKKAEELGWEVLWEIHPETKILVNDETKETYEWLLMSTLQATKHTPRVFFTDADPGMDATIDIHYSDTYPLHCIYHISQNLICNLKASLGSSFNDFIRDFYLCRNNFSPNGFDIQWHKLTVTYLKATNYLNSELYSSKEKWAKAYTNKFFMAGISSTLRIESENAIIKNVLQGHPSLCELATILDLRLSDEARYINHNEWYHANTSA